MHGEYSLRTSHDTGPFVTVTQYTMRGVPAPAGEGVTAGESACACAGDSADAGDADEDAAERLSELSSASLS